MNESRDRNSSEDPYAITIDPANGMIDIVLRGFWDKPTTDAYIAERSGIIGACRRSAHGIKVAVDIRAMLLQHQDVATALVDKALYRPGDRIAVIVESALTKISARRLMQVYDTDVHVSAFTSFPEARDWLLGQGNAQRD